MKTELELEAEKYVYDMDAEFFKDGISDYEIQQLAKIDFIEGATSKWVEKQKLKFAIEQLKEMDNKMKSVSDTSRDVLIRKIQELEQQLNQL